VSAAYDGKKVTHVSILSEKAKALRMANPWTGSSGRVTRVRDGHAVVTKTEAHVVVFDTEAGERYSVEPAG
jgi:hypothetical protein